MNQQPDASPESACDVFECPTCSHLLRGRCRGCRDGNSEMESNGLEQCAVYGCVSAKGLGNCRECTEAVCPLARSVETICPVRSFYEKKRCYARRLSEYFTERQNLGQDQKSPHVPEKTITRLRWYLFALDDYLSHGISRVSSDDIARKVGIKAHLIRRDLSQFGEFGRPSIGYETAFLRTRLAEVLHLDGTNEIIWVGAAFLSSNAGLIERLGTHGFSITAVLDGAPERVGSKIADFEVQSIDSLEEVIAGSGVRGAVLAVAEGEAQATADALVSAGIHGFLNLSSAVVIVPPNVCVRSVDIVTELFSLSYYCHQEVRGEPGA